MTMSGHGWGLEFYDCVINNDLARLEILAEQHKIDLNAKFTEVRKKNHLDLSPIHLVAYKGYTGMLQYLFDMKCDIHQTTATLRRTAFHFSVLRHKMACFHKLLSFGANPDARDTFGNAPCHYAAEDGAVNLLDVLLQLRNVDLNAQDITLKTPLMKATRNGKLEAVRRLLDAGCSLTVRDKNSDTALHFAARHGSARLLTALTEAGAAVGVDIVNAQNQWGHTPLIEAVLYSNKDAVASLLRAGCNVNLREFKNGDTALHVAVRKNYSMIVEQLLSTGRVGYVYNYQGELAIHDAILNQQKLETVRMFVQYNFDLDVPVKLDYDGSGGKLAARIAVDRENYDLLGLLAALGHTVGMNATNMLSNNSPGGATATNGANSQNVASGSTGTVDSDSASAVQRIVSELCQARSLKSLCRKQIRKQLGFSVDRKIPSLPLPPSVKDYVMLRDIFGAKIQ